VASDGGTRSAAGIHSDVAADAATAHGDGLAGADARGGPGVATVSGDAAAARADRAATGESRSATAQIAVGEARVVSVEREGFHTRGRGRFGRWWEILYMLVQRDLKARSKQAYLGYLWIFIQPLLLTGVFSVLVQQVLGRNNLSNIPYPVFLLAGVIPWMFFANSLNESTESLVKNVDLVRQVYFPREILAIYPVFARLVDVAIGCLALAAFMLLWHVPVSGWVVLAPVVLFEVMLFAIAFGLLLSAANVGWRDVSRGLPLILFLMLYAVPVLYPPELIPRALRPLYDLNPVAHLVDAFRTAVIGSQAPDLMALAVLGILGIISVVAAQRLFSVFDGVLADVI
jgi:lipopolysaccharide transport system permease protein